ncbi:MAG TPA: MerR family transcriptional regulator [Clostridia bacterium]|nr:MerR family transcriptional regulator [Clostridia bacterium]
MGIRIKGGFIIRIGEVSKITGLSYHTLRYYEDIGLIRNIARDGQGNRDYTEGDIKWVNFLLRLRITGMPINDVIYYAELYYSGDQSISKRIELLSSYKDRLTGEMKKIQNSIDFLANKIEFYYNKLNSIDTTQRGCL